MNFNKSDKENERLVLCSGRSIIRNLLITVSIIPLIYTVLKVLSGTVFSGNNELCLALILIAQSFGYGFKFSYKMSRTNFVLGKNKDRNLKNKIDHKRNKLKDRLKVKILPRMVLNVYKLRKIVLISLLSAMVGAFITGLFIQGQPPSLAEINICQDLRIRGPSGKKWKPKKVDKVVGEEEQESHATDNVSQSSSVEVARTKTTCTIYLPKKKDMDKFHLKMEFGYSLHSDIPCLPLALRDLDEQKYGGLLDDAVLYALDEGFDIKDPRTKDVEKLFQRFRINYILVSEAGPVWVRTTIKDDRVVVQHFPTAPKAEDMVNYPVILFAAPAIKFKGTIVNLGSGWEGNCGHVSVVHSYNQSEVVTEGDAYCKNCDLFRKLSLDGLCGTCAVVAHQADLDEIQGWLDLELQASGEPNCVVPMVGFIERADKTEDNDEEVVDISTLKVVDLDRPPDKGKKTTIFCIKDRKETKPRPDSQLELPLRMRLKININFRYYVQEKQKYVKYSYDEEELVPASDTTVNPLFVWIRKDSHVGVFQAQDKILLDMECEYLNIQQELDRWHFFVSMYMVRLLHVTQNINGVKNLMRQWLIEMDHLEYREEAAKDEEDRSLLVMEMGGVGIEENREITVDIKVSPRFQLFEDFWVIDVPYMTVRDRLNVIHSRRNIRGFDNLLGDSKLLYKVTARLQEVKIAMCATTPNIPLKPTKIHCARCSKFLFVTTKFDYVNDPARFMRGGSASTCFKLTGDRKGTLEPIGLKRDCYCDGCLDECSCDVCPQLEHPDMMTIYDGGRKACRNTYCLNGKVVKCSVCGKPWDKRVERSEHSDAQIRKMGGRAEMLCPIEDYDKMAATTIPLPRKVSFEAATLDRSMEPGGGFSDMLVDARCIKRAYLFVKSEFPFFQGADGDVHSYSPMEPEEFVFRVNNGDIQPWVNRSFGCDTNIQFPDWVLQFVSNNVSRLESKTAVKNPRISTTQFGKERMWRTRDSYDRAGALVYHNTGPLHPKTAYEVWDNFSGRDKDRPLYMLWTSSEDLQNPNSFDFPDYRDVVEENGQVVTYVWEERELHLLFSKNFEESLQSLKLLYDSVNARFTKLFGQPLYPCSMEKLFPIFSKTGLKDEMPGADYVNAFKLGFRFLGCHLYIPVRLFCNGMVQAIDTTNWSEMYNFRCRHQNGVDKDGNAIYDNHVCLREWNCAIHPARPPWGMKVREFFNVLAMLGRVESDSREKLLTYLLINSKANGGGMEGYDEYRRGLLNGSNLLSQTADPCSNHYLQNTRRLCVQQQSKYRIPMLSAQDRVDGENLPIRALSRSQARNVFNNAAFVRERRMRRYHVGEGDMSYDEIEAEYEETLESLRDNIWRVVTEMDDYMRSYLAPGGEVNVQRYIESPF